MTYLNEKTPLLFQLERDFKFSLLSINGFKTKCNKIITFKLSFNQTR